MAGPGIEEGTTYSPKVAFIYVFNLIVGTGALALPSVLTKGGWTLGTCFLALVAASSYIGVTFMIESMASANAVLAVHSPEQVELLAAAENGGEDDDDDGVATATATSASTTGIIARETCHSPAMQESGAQKGGPHKVSGSSTPPQPLHLPPSALTEGATSAKGSTISGRAGKGHSNLFDIVQRTEMGQMAELFFNKTGRIFFYVVLIWYLYGDATIYCTFVPRSLVGFIYGENTAPPWAFDVCLLGFVSIIVPFCFFDFQKTKFLQMFTLLVRNVALFTMIVLAAYLVRTQGSNVKGVPNFKLRALPNLFGGAVYAFMCHHSLPGIITPMREKAWVAFVLKSAFLSVFTIYFLLFLSCGLAFGLKAEDPITFNFEPAKFGLIGDFLLLFPVFTLSSNFPMLTITLRNNLDTLLHLLFPQGATMLPPVALASPKPNTKWHTGTRHGDQRAGSPRSPTTQQLRTASRSRRFTVTCIAVGPPILGCIYAEHQGVDVSSLIGLTGAYAGAAVMLVIPACLVHCSRVVVNQEVPGASGSKTNACGCWTGGAYFPHALNQHASPFRSPIWVALLVLLAILAIGFITCDQFLEQGAL